MFNKPGFILYLCILLHSCTENIKYNMVSVYNNSLSLEIPVTWIDKDSLRYSIKYYNLKFDTLIYSKGDDSYLTIKVYDSSRSYYGSNKFQLNEYLNNLLFYHSDSFSLSKSNTIDMGGIGMNIIEYTFNNSMNTKCYGSSVVFSTDKNRNYEICIYSLGAPASTFKNVAERIIKTIKINR